MHFALRESSDGGGRRRDFAMLLAIGLVLGWLGPYGTYGCLGLSDRLVFWMFRSLLAGMVCLAVFELVIATRFGASWPPLKRVLTCTLMASVPCALIGFTLAVLFRHAPASPLEFVDLFARTTIVTAVVGIPLLLARTPKAWGNPPPTLPEPAAKQGEPGFLRRIPARLGTNLLHIEVEDHYLRLHTDRGSDLILLRLSDAVGELDAAIGRQVHRSHWVSRHAVAAVERSGHRTYLVLTCGTRIPVSRTYLPALRRDGWL
jgi:hypothetical protein